MKIFINDIPVNIIKMKNGIDESDYDVVLDGSTKISTKKVVKRTLIKNASKEQIDQLLHLMTFKKFNNLDEATFAFIKRRPIVEFIKSRFRIVVAAGGIVEKESKVLLIYRRKKWDLPKGKIEKKETPKEGGKREVEEESNIKVELGPKLCTTWHSYIRYGSYTLKKTYWYLMNIKDDSKMKPQEEENIEEVKWMNQKEVEIALYNSYATIGHVVKKYREYKKLDVVG